MKLRTPMSVLRRAVRRGNQGFPVGTVAFYGPDDRRASKLVVGIFQYRGAEPRLTKWFSDTEDLRRATNVLQEAVDLLRRAQVRSVSMVDRIIGCPHEEGVDYPEGESCAECPFWHGRNRFTGEYEES